MLLCVHASSLPAGLQALIRRRVRVVEEDALYRIMVPQPLPLSWGRTVQPYDPAISLLRRVRALHHPHERMHRRPTCIIATDLPRKLSGDLEWSACIAALLGSALSTPWSFAFRCKILPQKCLKIALSMNLMFFLR